MLGVSGDVSLVQGSVTDADWSDGDVVFANSTCFDDELMGLLVPLLSRSLVSLSLLSLLSLVSFSL